MVDRRDSRKCPWRPMWIRYYSIIGVKLSTSVLLSNKCQTCISVKKVILKTLHVVRIPSVSHFSPFSDLWCRWIKCLIKILKIAFSFLVFIHKNVVEKIYVSYDLWRQRWTSERFCVNPKYTKSFTCSQVHKLKRVDRVE